MKKLNISFLIIFLIFTACEENEPIFNTKHVIIDFDATGLMKKSQMYNRGNLIPIKKDLAIAQLGMMEIVLVNLETGKLEKKLEIKNINEIVIDSINNKAQESYFLPAPIDIDLNSDYCNASTFSFQEFIYWPERKKYLTIVNLALSSQNDLNDQLSVDYVLLFDDNLENIEFILVEDLYYSGLLSGGFTLGSDKLFTKLHTFDHGLSYDFYEFHLNEANRLQFIKRLENINVSKTPYGSRFFSTFEMKSDIYLNLGDRIYQFDPKDITNGHFIQLPTEKSKSLLQVQSLKEDKAIGFLINDYENEPEFYGELIEFIDEFNSFRVVNSYNIFEFRFCSLKTFANNTYLLFYDQKNNHFFIEIYKDIM